MQNEPLLTDKQLEILLKSGPELGKIEPLLSPELRGVLVDLQKRAANHYASGTWQLAGGETITIPESHSRPQISESTRDALGTAYLGQPGLWDQARNTLKALLGDLGLVSSTPAGEPSLRQR